MRCHFMEVLPKYLGGAKPISIRLKALAVVQHLTSTTEHASLLIRHNLAILLIQELNSKPNDVNCHYRALSALINLTAVEPAASHFGQTAMLKCLSQFKQQPELASLADNVLQNIANSPDQARLLRHYSMLPSTYKGKGAPLGAPLLSVVRPSSGSISSGSISTQQKNDAEPCLAQLEREQLEREGRERRQPRQQLEQAQLVQMHGSSHMDRVEVLDFEPQRRRQHLQREMEVRRQEQMQHGEAQRAHDMARAYGSEMDADGYAHQPDMHMQYAEQQELFDERQRQQEREAEMQRKRREKQEAIARRQEEQHFHHEQLRQQQERQLLQRQSQQQLQQQTQTQMQPTQQQQPHHYHPQEQYHRQQGQPNERSPSGFLPQPGWL